MRYIICPFCCPELFAMPEWKITVVFLVLVLTNVFLLFREQRTATQVQSLLNSHNSLKQRNRRSLEEPIYQHNFRSFIEEEVSKQLFEKIVLLLPPAIESLPKDIRCLQCKDVPGHPVYQTEIYENKSKPIIREVFLKGEPGVNGLPGPRGLPGLRGLKGEPGLGLIAPEVRETLLNVSVKENGTVVLWCKFYGNPLPEIDWQLNNNSLSRRSIKEQVSSWESTSTLTIHNVTWKDAGEVQCECNSVLGEIHASGKLNVLSKPIMILSDGLITAYLKSNVTFPECRVISHPKLISLEWSKVYGRLPQDRMSYVEGRLVIRNVQFKDNGFYLCTATNSMGSTQKMVQLRTRSFDIIRAPGRQVLARSSIHSLTCVAVGDTLFAKWEQLPSRQQLRSVNVFQRNVHSITTSVTRGGCYTCQFTDGKVQRRRIACLTFAKKNINIADNPARDVSLKKKTASKIPLQLSFLSKPPRNITIDKVPHVLNCVAQGDHIVGLWRSNAESLAFTTVASSEVTNISVTVDHSGIFTCQFQDKEHSVLKHSVHLTYNKAPRLASDIITNIVWQKKLMDWVEEVTGSQARLKRFPIEKGPNTNDIVREFKSKHGNKNNLLVVSFSRWIAGAFSFVYQKDGRRYGFVFTNFTKRTENSSNENLFDKVSISRTLTPHECNRFENYYLSCLGEKEFFIFADRHRNGWAIFQEFAPAFYTVRKLELYYASV